MNKLNSNEKGLTLVELLAAIVLTTIIFTFASSILIKGMENYNLISTENGLRDEADLILINIYKELYTTKQSDIDMLKEENNIQNGINRDSYILYKEITLDNGDKEINKTGFINGKLYLKNNEYKIQNPNIKLITIKDTSYIKETEKGVYNIRLVLTMENKKKTMKFETEVRTIYDKINEGEKK